MMSKESLHHFSHLHHCCMAGDKVESGRDVLQSLPLLGEDLPLLGEDVNTGRGGEIATYCSVG